MMNLKNLKKYLNLKYDVVIISRGKSSGSINFRFKLITAILILFGVFVAFNTIILGLFLYTPAGRILPKSPYLIDEELAQMTELQQKVLELSREVQRVQKINERLNLILEGKPIPIDPRDLDTNYQKEKMLRDSLRILGNKLYTNNFYIAFRTLITSYFQDLDQEHNNTNKYLFFIKPADGLMTRGFNKEISHYGIDIALPVGSAVRSSASGIVIFADYTINDGYKIIISHMKGYITVYKHLSMLLKKEKDIVKQGEVIALSGNTGKLTTGPHLHFEIWKYQTPIDPEKILVDLK